MSTTPDQKLDELFAALRSDSPAAHDHDLAVLLRHASPIPDPLLPSTQQRKRKRAMISIITIALLTAVTLLTQDFTPTVQDVQTAVQPAIQAVAPPANERETIRQLPKYNKPKESLRKKKLLTFTKAPLAPNAWVVVTDPELPLLGIERLSNGDILLDDGHTDRILFPVDSFAKVITAKSTLNVPFTLFPKFVTDTKGNLVMIGEHTIQNGRSSRITFIAGQPSVLPNLNYYRTSSMEKKGATVDTAVMPPIKTTPLKVGVGIMTLDTVIHTRFGDLNQEKAIEAALFEQLAAKDSLYKLQFGGEAGLNAKFGNALLSDLTADERSILHEFDSIGALPLSDLEKVELQYRYLGQVVRNGRYPSLTRLKFERLYLAIDYKFYLLRHKEDEKKFAGIDNYIPVLVRPNTGSLPDPTYDNGLIFWFEPSEELNEAMQSLRGNRAAVDVSTLRRVVVYPNPTTMYLFVQTREIPGRSLTVDLQNLLGFNVLPSRTVDVTGGIADTRLDVSAVPPGIYFLTITYENGTRENKRIIVQ